MKWSVLPFLLITPSLIIGILLNDYYKGPESLVFYVAVFSSVILIFQFLLRRAISLHHQPAISVLPCFSYVFLGYFSSQMTWLASRPNISLETLGKSEYFTAIIDSKPDRMAKSHRYEVIIQKMKIDDEWHTMNNKAILYDLDSNIFTYGDIILIKGRPAFLDRQKNPHAFDYSLFLNRKGIYLQAFCNADNSRLLKENKRNSIRYLALRIGDSFEKILSLYMSESRELNMARAMVVGRRNEITPEMEYVYEATGTSHILAVSGLHVGIIFLVVSAVFKFAKQRGLKWLYYSVVLFSIWSFALITGFSPSVRRAALMLSFIVIAEMIRRNNNIYNTLLASAFCLLLFSPNLIFSVSFQFSYMAVLGIIFFYKKIYVMLYVKNRYLDFFWKITALSISVQIATFAINIYYFQHFPALFLITNLFAIPTAMVVIVGSLAIFSTSFIVYIPEFIGVIVEKWVFVYNEIMVFFSNLDITSIENISIKGVYVFLIIILVFALARFIEIKRLYLFRFISAVLCFLALVVLYNNYKMGNQLQLFVYATNNESYVDVFVGNTCYSNIFEPSEETRRVMHYNIQPNRDFHMITEVKSMDDLPSSQSIGGNEILVFGNKSILFINEIVGLSVEMNGLQIDFLVIGKSNIEWLENAASSTSFKNVVLDGSIKNWEIDEVTKKLPSNVQVYSVDRDGAFTLRI